MRKIEKLIPTAMEAVVNCGVKSTNDGSVSSEFNGYISSFGASLISAGLLPTLVFYSQKGESNDRHKIVHCLEYILKHHFHELLDNNTTLIEEIRKLVKNKLSTARMEDKLTDAAVALKLALRTFPKPKINSR